MEKKISNLKNIVLGTIIFYIFTKIINYLFGTVCTLKLLCGLPCPFCGITRSLKYLLSFQLKKSFEMHPLLIFVVVGLILYIFLKYKKMKTSYILYIYAIICIILFGLLYCYRMINYYPNKEPMVYFKYNLLQLIK